MHSTAAGARVRRLRERRALTQEQLAETAGVAVRTVQRAEDGVMSAETVAGLAAALQVPVETLTAADQPYPQITPMLFYADPASLDWLVEVFGLTVRMRHINPDGRIAHAELVLGDGLIMAIGPSESDGTATPADLGMMTQGLYVMVDDVDRHHAHAGEHEATIVAEPSDAHGHRRYMTADPEGHLWQFWTPLP